MVFCSIDVSDDGIYGSIRVRHQMRPIAFNRIEPIHRLACLEKVDIVQRHIVVQIGGIGPGKMIYIGQPRNHRPHPRDPFAADIGFTQQEVNDFGVQGYNKIEGDLIIGNKDNSESPIDIDLKLLNQLKEIIYEKIFSPTIKL